MSSSLEFHRRGWSSQRIARHALIKREPETKQRTAAKGECPHCGRVFARGLHLHILKKHSAK